jgi:membrane protease subunit HflK
MVQEAQGYKESEVAKASGEAQRFDAIYAAYQNAKEVTQKRMYLEAMEDVFSRAKRIIIDKNAGANTIVPIQLPQQPAALPGIAAAVAPTAPAALTPMPATTPNLGGN